MAEQFKKELARMTSLADRFASEGQMSLNKLTEAAVYSRVRRAGWHYRPLVSKDRMLLELSSTVKALKESDLSPGLLSALETGLEYLKGGKNILSIEARDIVEAFCKKRLSTVERLRSRSLKDLYRTGWHPSFGQLTVLRQAAYMANHEQDHLPDIETLCSQMRHMQK